jgi:hypothetical protein
MQVIRLSLLRNLLLNFPHLSLLNHLLLHLIRIHLRLLNLWEHSLRCLHWHHLNLTLLLPLHWKLLGLALLIKMTVVHLIHLLFSMVLKFLRFANNSCMFKIIYNTFWFLLIFGVGINKVEHRIKFNLSFLELPFFTCSSSIIDTLGSFYS